MLRPKHILVLPVINRALHVRVQLVLVVQLDISSPQLVASQHALQDHMEIVQHRLVNPVINIALHVMVPTLIIVLVVTQRDISHQILVM